MVDIHTLFMQRALDLSLLGRGKVEPNPMVGCVIVKENRIIGEGYHVFFGGPHAEVNAVKGLSESDLEGADVYVTLEPCSHYGKTPPCANMLAGLPVKRIIIGSVDYNPLVEGKGIALLKEAGKEVITGVLQEECEKVNAAFFTFLKKKRPYIILKWAQTGDGFIARKNNDSKWISNELSRKLVHKWRSEVQAILVGSNTVFHDNPQLTTRDWSGKNPLRLIIDRKARLENNFAIFDQSVPTIIYNEVKKTSGENPEYVKLQAGEFIESLLADLYDRSILNLFIEGGSTLINEFIKHNLWDEARVFIGAKSFEEGIKAPEIIMTPEKYYTIGNDKLLIYKNKENG